MRKLLVILGVLILSGMVLAQSGGKGPITIQNSAGTPVPVMNLNSSNETIIQSTGSVHFALGPNGGVDAPVTITLATSSPETVSSAGFYINSSGASITFNLPAISSSGSQFCFRNTTAATGVITLQAPASTYIDLSGAVGTAAGTLVSGGALGDAACVVAIDTTHYFAYIGTGTWTNN